jgi:hypothetical protein
MSVKNVIGWCLLVGLIAVVFWVVAQALGWLAVLRPVVVGSLVVAALWLISSDD